MATKSMAYDHAAYLARQGNSVAEAGGAAGTAYGKFAAFTNLLLFTAQVTVTAAGTVASGTSGFTFYRFNVLTTATSSVGNVALSTNAIGYTTNVALATAAGGLSINQGDYIWALSSSDTTVKALISYETGIVPGATVTS